MTGSGRLGFADRALSPSGTEPLRVSSATAVTIPDAESARHFLAGVIAGASVSHSGIVSGGTDSRSLGYYLGVGIDCFNHDHGRHETLLLKAADAVLAVCHRLPAPRGLGSREPGPEGAP